MVVLEVRSENTGSICVFSNDWSTAFQVFKFFKRLFYYAWPS